MGRLSVGLLNSDTFRLAKAFDTANIVRVQQAQIRLRPVLRSQ